MQLRIPFTNLSLRMNVGTAGNGMPLMAISVWQTCEEQSLRRERWELMPYMPASIYMHEQ